MRLFLDPGHGGTDPGAIGPTGLHESTVTLDLARRVRALAERHHIDCDQSRYMDTASVGLTRRAELSNLWGADLLISIHCNAATSREASGIEVWTTKGQTAADPWADTVLTELARYFPRENLRRDTSDGDGDKESNFTVLAKAKAPAILIETGFISHPETEALMRTDAWRQQMAVAIMSALLEHRRRA